MKRYFVVLEVDNAYEGAKEDVATWIDYALSAVDRLKARTVEATVYDSITDLIADLAELDA